MLFDKENPSEVEAGQDFTSNLNPNSLKVLTESVVEPSLAGAQPGEKYQFMRQSYFAVDPDSAPGALVFNRTVTLRDTWKKVRKQN